MLGVRFDDVRISTEGFIPAATPNFRRYKGRVQTFPYVNLTPDRSEEKNQIYRAAILENNFLRITVLPDFGGRVYSMFDKTAQQELLYKNDKILMREIAPRDAWFAGGIEFNFPVGHALHTSKAVDVELVQNDLEAAVILSDRDRVTGLSWAVKLSLQEDSQMMRQDVTLRNDTRLSQPFDYWMNAAVKVTKTTQFLYPTRNVISDEYAEPLNWPVHNGVDLRDYTQVHRPSSFFSTSPYEDYFGVYYPENAVGLLHFSNRTDLPGMKLFTWGSNGDGEQWYKLLCADGKPYAEIQSGIPIDQSERSLMEPLTQLKFTEWWVPIYNLSDQVTSPVSGSQVLPNRLLEIPAADLTPSISTPAKKTESQTTWGIVVRAYRLETEFDYSGAAKVLQSLMRDAPDFVPAAVALARVRLKQGLSDDIDDILEPVLESRPRYEPTRLEALYLKSVAQWPATDKIADTTLELAMSPIHKSRVLLMTAEAWIADNQLKRASYLLRDALHNSVLVPVAAARAVILLWRIQGHDSNCLLSHMSLISDADRSMVRLEEDLFKARSSIEAPTEKRIDRLLELACDYVRLQFDQSLIDVIIPVCPQTPAFQYLLAMALGRNGRITERDSVLSRISIHGADFPWEPEVVQSIHAALRATKEMNQRRGQHAYWLGHYMEAVGRLPEAIEAYKEATLTLPSDLREGLVRYLHVRQAVVWEQLGNPAASKYYAEKAALMDGRLDAHVAIDLDVLLTRFGSQRQRTRLHDSLDLSDPVYQIRKVDHELARGRVDAALDIVSNARNDFHEGQFWPRAYYLKSYILKSLNLIRGGQLDDALEHLLRAKEYPSDFGIGQSEGLHHMEQLDYLIALVCERRGDLDAAEKWLNKVVVGTAPALSELYYYRLSAMKKLETMHQQDARDWLIGLSMQGIPEGRGKLLVALRNLLLEKGGARDDVRLALELEDATHINWRHQLVQMNHIIPEYRTPAVIWEAFALEVE